jgi:hypothetical protein
MRLQELKVSKAAFRAWLNQRSPTRPVGIQGESGDCALARFLNSKTKKRQWGVGEKVCSCKPRSAGDDCYFTVVTVEYTLPLWARDFVRRYDKAADTRPQTLLKLLRAC